MRAYADEVARRVHDVLGTRLVGVWLVGSGALGDYDPRRSDVDVQAVATGRVPLDERRELSRRLGHEVLPNPARGLEFVLYAREELSGPAGPRFQLNLNTGPRMDFHVAYEAEEDPGFWFVIDADIARSQSVPLIGPAATEVFPELPRPRVAAAVLEGLDWWAAHSGAPAPTLLNACRSWAWATDGRWRSKTESGRWAAARLPDPSGVEAALRVHAGAAADPPGSDDVEAVVAAARAALQRLAVR